MDFAFKTTYSEATRHLSASQPSHQIVSQQFWNGSLVTNSGKKKGDIWTHILHPKMQKLELEKLNFTKLWKAGFLAIDLFSYSSWDTLPEEEEKYDIYG